jgi:hypothetical protein
MRAGDAPCAAVEFRTCGFQITHTSDRYTASQVAKPSVKKSPPCCRAGGLVAEEGLEPPTLGL